MTQTVPAYLLDPTQATIRTIRLSGSNVLESLCRHIDCRLVERIWIDADHCAYVDEEGMLAPATGLWSIPQVTQPVIAGRAVIVADDGDGGSASPRLPMEQFAALIRVFRPVAVPEFADIPSDNLDDIVVIGARVASLRLDLQRVCVTVVRD